MGLLGKRVIDPTNIYTNFVFYALRAYIATVSQINTDYRMFIWFAMVLHVTVKVSGSVVQRDLQYFHRVAARNCD